ncbi:MAG TPA: HEAT repeat domain-containing protein [Polyangiaceae bacterium]|nr:HEAT repeat domain-containing protein [Polyangiaceae bacterium]
MRAPRVWFGILTLLSSSALVACGGGVRPEVRAALTGTLPELKQEIAKAEKTAPLSDARLNELAHAVAEREIAGAAGADGAEQIALFRPCLSELQDALDERAARGDEVAAVATLLLFEAGKRNANDLVSRYSEADSGAFRSLAARAALSPSQAELRRRFFTDPDERVRRSAFEAAVKSPSSALLPDLLEAARLDPSPSNRARAAQAVGRIGSEPAVLSLSDLFSSGDEQQKLAVLDAWSESPSFHRGGERELARVLTGRAGDSGLVPVSAATLLLRSRDSHAAAVAVLARAITDGSDDEKRLAVMSAPLSDPSIQKALEKASTSPSPEVTPLVLARLAELPRSAGKARAALEKLAADKGDSGLEASYTLARLGSPSAAARLERELSSERASRRLRAAVTLAGLGKKQHLASTLADQDPLVRATLACRLSEAP